MLLLVESTLWVEEKMGRIALEKSSERIDRERRTLEAMIGIYCRERHGAGKEICIDCQNLRAYATKRLDQCPYGKDKPSCARCTVHCYKPVMREKIRKVMQYAGARMTLRHPVLSFLHVMDSWRT